LSSSQRRLACRSTRLAVTSPLPYRIAATWTASGVTVHASTADSSSTRFYLAGGIPSPAATETEAPEPFGGYLNLPPRLVTMEARVAALDQSLGTLPLIVRPGTLTIAGMLPMP